VPQLRARRRLQAVRGAVTILLLGLLAGACSGSVGVGTTTTPAATSIATTTTNTIATTLPTTSVVTTTAPPQSTTTTALLPAFPGQEELTAARALWAEQGLTRYRFRATAGTSWGSSGPYEVYVDGEQVVEVAVGSASGSFTNLTPYLEFFGPVEYLFGVVESVPDGDLTVVYDPEWGYPNLISFDDPGCADEGWGLQVESLEAFDGPMPAEAPLPAPDLNTLELADRFSRLAAVVVARVVGPASVADGVGLCEQAWEVAGDVEQAVILDSDRAPAISPGSRLLIQDLGGLHPRALWGLEGARVLLPLAYYDFDEGAQQGYASRRWAAVVSDQGLDFVGAMGDLYDAELPLLCGSGSSMSTPLDPALGLPLLLAWAEGIAGGQGAEGALRQACEAVTAERS
jgi:hypothetical protein